MLRLFSRCSCCRELWFDCPADVIDCLESISILHVLLMIYFRLLIIKNPMTRTGSLKFRKTLVIITWIVPIVSKLPYLFLWKYHYEFIIYMNIQHHILSTLSVLLIITLYFGISIQVPHEGCVISLNTFRLEYTYSIGCIIRNNIQTNRYRQL